MDDGEDSWGLGDLLSTAKGVYGDVTTADAARRSANATQNLANAQNAANAQSAALKKYLPWGIGGLVVLIVALFLFRK